MNPHSIETSASLAREASRRVATASTQTKDRVLHAVAEAVETERDRVLEANAADLKAAEDAGLSGPKLKRLLLTEQSLAQLAGGVRQIAEMPDPVGAVTLQRTVPSGLDVQKIRAPLGVVAMIYEARPAVTVDAFALCFKAGNACMLKGGREAAQSNAALAALVHNALQAEGLPAEALCNVVAPEREDVKKLLSLSESIDLLIPRGGESLIRFVHEHSKIPTVLHFHGVCHAYIDAQADLDMALEILATGKTSAPAVCNALECAVVHEAVAEQLLPKLAERAQADGFTVHADERARAIEPRFEAATDRDWGHEYLDLDLALKIVPSMDAAIAFIEQHSSSHTEAIVTANPETAEAFVGRVQSSCVMVNASTRFNDGFQLGLGAEIGISTSRVHAYGPMGLEELTTQRWVVRGTGQTR